jgi:hypothetical protein
MIHSRSIPLLFLVLLTLATSMLQAQQKGQWVPGQAGLNAGIVPEPGITVANLTLNYSADTLTDASGNPIAGLTGNYEFWLPLTAVYYVPKANFLGGRVAFAAILPVANGSLTVPQFGLAGGGYGYADTWVQPFTLGWHFNRADTYVAYAFVAPTGRYTAGANDNVGSGYWGQNIVTGTTFYLTKNKGTTLNLTTDWEIHSSKRGTDLTPGQAFTMEWGLGQTLPLAKDFSKLLQIGVTGYDQWQVTDNGGTIGLGIPASILPKYSVHAIGFQTNFLLPKKNLNFSFKYLPEYSATAHSQGRTIAFGGGYTFKFPKK